MSVQSSPCSRKRSFGTMMVAGDTPHAADFTPTSWQKEIYEAAMQRNTIAVVGTIVGKTIIAAMLIKEIGRTLKSAPGNKLIIFLAPTVHLVNQHYGQLRAYSDLYVEEYYGAKGINTWILNHPDKEILKHSVLIMTPQILLAALKQRLLDLNHVCLMVFDECHHATPNHPYGKLMKEFYSKCNEKPKIFGMTASSVIGTALSSTMDYKEHIFELESILDAQIYISNSARDLETCMPSLQEVNVFYDPPTVFTSKMNAEFGKSCSMFGDKILSMIQRMVSSHCKSAIDKIKALHKRLFSDYSNIVYCLNSLGVACAYEAVNDCMENIPSIHEECEFCRECCLLFNQFLEDVLCIIQKFLTSGNTNLTDVGVDHSKATSVGYISPKLNELLRIFHSFGGDTEIVCLIFVERIIAAKVIERFMKKVSGLSHYTFSLAGSNSSIAKVQKETVRLLPSGKVNFMFATDIIEENIHVLSCSLVIYFDLPRTLHSFAQSRDRSRQYCSRYILMLERGNLKQRDEVFDIIMRERSMIDTSLNRGSSMCSSGTYAISKNDVYSVDSTGAYVTADSSINLIYRYCSVLPGDMFLTPKPIFELSSSGDLFSCRLKMPPNAPFETIIGPSSEASHLSKQLACLEACKKLHQLGALNDKLLPFPEENKVNSSNFEDETSGAGTTKRKELHGSVCIRSLIGNWGESFRGATFQSYRISFTCVNNQIYAGFVLLLESKLDDDVGNFELDLYLSSNKLVKTCISPCGDIHLGPDEVAKAKCFQGLFFNGVFGRLFVFSKSRAERKFLFSGDNNPLWVSSNMYLLLPLVSLKSPCDAALGINWTAVDSCTSVVEFLKKQCTSDDCKEEPLPHKPENANLKSQIPDFIYLANECISNCSLKNKIAIAVHTGRVYSVLDIIVNSSAESPFDGSAGGTPEYANYSEYFSKKYGIILMHPRQPLLLLKQSHNPHNLLVDFTAASSKKSSLQLSGIVSTEKPRNHVHIPPELLVVVDVPIDVLKSLYLLPSVMHRLESLILASQLRKEISCNFHIPILLVLEALTSVRCCEDFSMERLELLGDSVLQYAVSCHLFLKHPKMDEGQLTALRSRAVCNSTLHKVGVGCNLQGYIRDCAFDPRRWIAPGQRSMHPVPCSCGVDSLEVPLGREFQTETRSVTVGKSCDRGHRWICSKTISDCVEALIGGYYIGAGIYAAVHLMKSLGIEAEADPLLLDDAIRTAALRSYTPNSLDVKMLESKLQYQFFVKGLLLEALTHATDQSVGVGYCYQRLEFLGDTVLGLLVTKHLYQHYSHIDPGVLTDLRSMSVCNENFARVSVKYGFHKHLQHCSDFLSSHITNYVESLAAPSDYGVCPSQSVKVPKVLGDLFESIAGAVLIDCKLNLNEVWRIFEPLLSPIVSPDELELHPLRKLRELSDSFGYSIKELCTTNGEAIQAEIRLQLKDDLLVGQGCRLNKKAAKEVAARNLLKELESRGIMHPLSGDKKDIKAPHQCVPEAIQIVSSLNKSSTLPADDLWAKPVISPVQMRKGGPRQSLNALCKKQLWPLPTFECSEKKSRSPIDFGEGSETKKGFNGFESRITLHIPNYGTVECEGENKADKKSSMDSAALAMLHELERIGKLSVGQPS